MSTPEIFIFFQMHLFIVEFCFIRFCCVDSFLEFVSYLLHSFGIFTGSGGFKKCCSFFGKIVIYLFLVLIFWVVSLINILKRFKRNQHFQTIQNLTFSNLRITLDCGTELNACDNYKCNLNHKFTWIPIIKQIWELNSFSHGPKLLFHHVMSSKWNKCIC